ncbi:hypothetical protein V3A08_14565 [Tenacibaculum maritimum]|uniref:hypothetical protein n=1 Tax=Tenacibaculum maritimum TaxID=107401 RepID=UPI001330D4B7|nr:hypothetical protein [Tenacibaculum maritimum]
MQLILKIMPLLKSPYNTDQQENKQYKDALNKAEGKTSPFYIAMDAEPANQNWFEVQ